MKTLTWRQVRVNIGVLGVVTIHYVVEIYSNNLLNNKDMTYQIYDYMNRHIMFVHSIQEAQYIIDVTPIGSFHWKLVSSNNIKGD
jgi:hypothetical protein